MSEQTVNKDGAKKVMYEVTKYGKPELVEIEFETDKFVKVVGRNSRDKKNTDWKSFFDTIWDAKTWRINLAVSQIEQVKAQVEYYQKQYEKLLKEMETWE